MMELHMEHAVLRSAIRRILEKRSDFGDVLFGDERVDGAPRERDTPEERRVARELASHFSIGRRLSSDSAKRLLQLSTDPRYAPFLVLPARYKQVFRGMVVESSYLRKMLGTVPSSKGQSSVSFVFRPVQATASWTTSHTMAVRYARVTSLVRGFGIVMTAVVDDNVSSFVINPDRSKSFDFAQNLVREHETIGVGPIAVSHVEWWAS